MPEPSCRSCELKSHEIRHLIDELDRTKQNHTSYRTVNENHSLAMETELAELQKENLRLNRDFISRNIEYMGLREKEATWAQESFEFERFQEHHRTQLGDVRSQLAHTSLEVTRITALERVTRHSFMKANTLMDRSRTLLKRWCSHDPASQDQLISKSAELIDELSTDHL